VLDDTTLMLDLSINSTVISDKSLKELQSETKEYMTYNKLEYEKLCNETHNLKTKVNILMTNINTKKIQQAKYDMYQTKICVDPELKLDLQSMQNELVKYNSFQCSDNFTDIKQEYMLFVNVSSNINTSNSTRPNELDLVKLQNEYRSYLQYNDDDLRKYDNQIKQLDDKIREYKYKTEHLKKDHSTLHVYLEYVDVGLNQEKIDLNELKTQFDRYQFYKNN
jgi:hypothetical protein